MQIRFAQLIRLDVNCKGLIGYGRKALCKCRSIYHLNAWWGTHWSQWCINRAGYRVPRWLPVCSIVFFSPRAYTENVFRAFPGIQRPSLAKLVESLCVRGFLWLRISSSGQLAAWSPHTGMAWKYFTVTFTESFQSILLDPVDQILIILYWMYSSFYRRFLRE